MRTGAIDDTDVHLIKEDVIMEDFLRKVHSIGMAEVKLPLDIWDKVIPENEDNVEEFISVLDSIDLIQEDNNSVGANTIAKSWKNLLRENQENSPDDENLQQQTEADNTTLLSLLQKVPGCANATEDDINEWIVQDEEFEDIESLLNDSNEEWNVDEYDGESEWSGSSDDEIDDEGENEEDNEEENEENVVEENLEDGGDLDDGGGVDRYYRKRGAS
ncbi:nucleoplasmin-like protein ANO39 [Schistocerca americana]|uniref:nucleoplasmin-like protein ANO39 n=1 Tax=Schistocerca americana TaxID=7009 RepID=UPI001F501E0C|nr:nucleoplasmin-like protein ANO39 [Schistocerca americana]